MKRVQLESPYRGNNYEQTELNIEYAHLCIADCLSRNEAPFASHILYTKATDDTNPVERAFGIEAGFAFLAIAEKSVVYTDFGISEGMKKGIQRALDLQLDVEYRKLPEEVMHKLITINKFNQLWKEISNEEPIRGKAHSPVVETIDWNYSNIDWLRMSKDLEDFNKSNKKATN